MDFNSLMQDINNIATQGQNTFNNLWGVRQGIIQTVHGGPVQTPAASTQGASASFPTVVDVQNNVGKYAGIAIMAAGLVMLYKVVK